MQSNNPVFNNSDGFNGKPYAGFGDAPVITQVPGKIATGRMTIDSVVQSTAVTLGVLLVAALATWVLSPDVEDPTANLAPLFAAATIGSLGAFVVSLVANFKPNPIVVLGYAALEGVALGAISKVVEAQTGAGTVTAAVIGTFAAFAGTLAAYKVLDIKVGQRFRAFVVAAMFGMVGLSLMEIVLNLFGAGLGIFGNGGVGLLFAAAGLVLGIFMLILDFDFIERGIAAGMPASESWRASFGLTVSLVWIYINLLRLLQAFNSN